jgi:hypothetical protein
MADKIKSEDHISVETAQASPTGTNPNNEKLIDNNIASFAKVFTTFAGALALMVSALPIALTNVVGLPPFSEEFRVLVPTITSIFCYVGIALVFHFRHSIMAQSSIAEGGKWTRGPALTWLPIFLVIVCVVGFSGYFFSIKAVENPFPLSPVWPYISFIAGFTSPVIAISLFAVSEYYLKLMNTDDKAIISGMKGG